MPALVTIPDTAQAPFRDDEDARGGGPVQFCPCVDGIKNIAITPLSPYVPELSF